MTIWQYLIPQHTISRAFGKLANSSVPWFKNWLIRQFIAHYGVDMSIALKPDPAQYNNFNDFFTRALKPEIRPVAAGEDVIACPVDGKISQLGGIEKGKIFQAKGHYFDVFQLLGGHAERAALFENGCYATVYLSPKDYHRVHMPLSGKLREMIYVPGQLFSVNPPSVDRIPNIFSRNERIIALFETPLGNMVMVLVGAMIVASIETAWEGLVAPQRQKNVRCWNYLGAEPVLKKGEEMGRFRLGSTVIVLLDSDKIQWFKELGAGSTVVMGQGLGTSRCGLS